MAAPPYLTTRYDREILVYRVGPREDFHPLGIVFLDIIIHAFFYSSDSVISLAVSGLTKTVHPERIARSLRVTEFFDATDKNLDSHG